VEVCPPSNPDLRVDILVLGLHSQPLALDVSIQTPVRASNQAGVNLLDATALAKIRHYKVACLAEGWLFQPFIGDCFGAFRSDARSFVGDLIRSLQHAYEPLPESEVGPAIWSTLTGAAVARAGAQLHRAASLDSPLGMNLNQLSLVRAPAAEGESL